MGAGTRGGSPAQSRHAEDPCAERERRAHRDQSRAGLSRDHPGTLAGEAKRIQYVHGSWRVLPFKEDALELQPRRASGRGSAAYTVTLHNGGNARAQYALSGEDDEQKLTYCFPANPGGSGAR